MHYEYRLIEYNTCLPTSINELGSRGWRIISVNASNNGNTSVIMERVIPEEDVLFEHTMPVAKTISDPDALYKCMERVKRYDWSNVTVSTSFLSIDDVLSGDVYSDDGEFEMYLSDGFYFIGTDVSDMSDDELKGFISENKNKFRNPDDLKIYYIDYPEDK